MNPGEIFHDLDEVLDGRLDLHARPVVDLEVLDDLGHLGAVEVEEQVDEVAVDKALN